MRTLLLDANNLLYRIFWVNKNRKSGDINMSTLMFLRSLKSYVDKFKPDPNWLGNIRFAGKSPMDIQTKYDLSLL